MRSLQASRVKATVEEACVYVDADVFIKPAPAAAMKPPGKVQHTYCWQWQFGQALARTAAVPANTAIIIPLQLNGVLPFTWRQLVAGSMVRTG